MIEQDLAARLQRDLQALATDAGWDYQATATDQPYGSYTDPITDALEIAAVTQGQLNVAPVATQRLVRRLALGGCLDRLERYYATLVDTTTDGVHQKLSQIRESIALLRKDAAPVVASGVNLRGIKRPDYALGLGNVDYNQTPVA